MNRILAPLALLLSLTLLAGCQKEEEAAPAPAALVAPADGQRLVARGEVVRPGRTLIVTRADVYAIRDEQWTLCAIMQQTIMAMQGKSERAG